jgi:hypothetical protein
MREARTEFCTMREMQEARDRKAQGGLGDDFGSVSGVCRQAAQGCRYSRWARHNSIGLPHRSE